MKKIPPLGPTAAPAPAGPPRELADPSRRRLLALLAEWSATRPPTVGELVATLGGHPNTTRHHLRVLLEAGLLAEERAVPGAGRGRPAARYVVTATGRQALSAAQGGGAAEEYVALAAAFAERLALRGGDPGDDARAIGRAWGVALSGGDARDAGGPGPAPGGGAGGGGAAAPGSRPAPGGAAGRSEVVGLLDRLGFSPLPEPGPAAGADTTVLLRTCPLLDAARRHPEVVCQVHLGLVAGALEAHDQPAEGVRLAPFARPGACELGLPGTLVE